MACPPPRTLAAFQAGLASAEESSSVLRHLAVCVTCRAQVDPVTEVAPPPAAPAPDAPAQSPSSPVDAVPGQRFGRYVVLWESGRGGMGTVFAAYDPQLDRKVALKVLHAEGSRHPALRAQAQTRLLREAQAVARVSHPNTMAVHDVGVHEGQVFLALEHLDGHSLRDWLRAGPRPWPEVLAVLRQAGAGLLAVHRAGLVHRDFKPGNVMVTADGRVKVFDFGLARLAAGASGTDTPVAPGTVTGPLAAELTAAGFLSGTPGYVAPELLAGGVPTPLSDQFAFGVTLYQCLTGKRPFGDAAHVGDLHLIEQGPPFDSLEAEAPPPWLQALLRRCLATRPGDRFAGMAEVLAALDADPRQRRRVWALRGLAAAAVALVAMLAFAGGRGPACASAAELEAGLLPPAQRAAVQARLAGPATGAIARELEAQVAAWARERAEACGEARAHPEALATLQRTECLERRGLALSALLEVLTTAEPEVLGRAEGLVDQQLVDPSCRQARAAHVGDEVRPEQRPLALELRRGLLQGRAQGLTGRLAEAVELDHQMTARAADAGLAGFEGEGLVQGAVHEMYQGHDDVALPHLEAGLGRLLAAGADDQAVLASRWLMGLLVQRPDGLPTARHVLVTAEGLWARLGRPRSLEVDLLGARQSLAWAEGRHADAVGFAERRVALAVEVFGPHALEVVQARGALAIALWESGEVRRSNEEDAQALASLERRQGASNPMLFTRMVSLALGLRHEGRRPEARALLERARTIAAAADPTNATAVGIDAELAQVLVGADDAQALRLVDGAVAVLEKLSSPHELIKALVIRARVQTSAGHPEEALRDTALAERLLSGISDPTQKRRRAVTLAEAQALAAQGQGEAARRRYEEALALPLSVIPDERAELRFGLARALRAAHQDPERADELARQARADYAAFPGFEKERQAIEAFLSVSPGR